MMRKLCVILLCVALLVQVPISSASEAIPTVSVNSASGKIGETIDVKVELSNCDGFANIGLEFGYDATVLVLEEVINGVSAAQMTAGPVLEKNPYHVIWNSVDNVEYNGTLVTLRFRIAENAPIGTYPITVDYYKGRNGNNVDGVTVNYDEDFSSLGLCYVSGEVSVRRENAVVSVQDARTLAGGTVNVTVELEKCSGFSNLGLEFGYNADVFTLEKVTNGVTAAQMTKGPDLAKNPYHITWNSAENVVHNGTLVTLQFKVAEDAPLGTYPITVDYYKGRNGNNVDGTTVNYDENLKSLGLVYYSGEVVIDGDETAEPDGAYVKINNAKAGVGGTVDVTVDLIGCEGFSNIGLEFGYDASILSLEKVTNGVSNAQMTKAPTITTNPYNITWNSAENVVHNGTLVTLQFKVAEDVPLGTYPITVDYYKGRNGNNVDGKTVNYDDQLESLGLNYVSGELLIVPAEYIVAVEEQPAESGVACKITACAPGELHGIFAIALYDGGKMQQMQLLPAAEERTVTFAETGNRVRVIWLRDTDTLIPLGDFAEIFVESLQN